MERGQRRKPVTGQKLTPSAKLCVVGETIGAALSLIMLIVAFSVYLANHRIGLMTYSAVFYPVVICLILSFVLGINQLLRGFDTLTLVSLIVSAICLIAAVTFIILEVVYYGMFYIAPFTFVNA